MFSQFGSSIAHVVFSLNRNFMHDHPIHSARPDTTQKQAVTTSQKSSVAATLDIMKASKEILSRH